MNRKKITTIASGICLVGILGLGFALRSHDYQKIPLPGESRDEYSFAWLGLSLLTVGRPIATSGLPAYDHQYHYLNVDQIYSSFANQHLFPIDTPWFDHPPLFSFVPGIMVARQGVTTFRDVSVVTIRKPMIAIGMVNVLLAGLLAYVLFGKVIALAAMALYATDPLAVIGSRMVQAENLLITLFLAMLIVLYWYHKSHKGALFWLMVALAGMGLLVKLSGISLVLSALVLIAVFEKKDRIQKLLFLGVGSLVIGSLFIVYGWLYDWPLFLSVLASNGSRLFADGLSAGFLLLSRQNITRDVTSGVVMVGFLSLILLADAWKREKTVLFIAIPAFCYLVVFLLFGSENYGWYKFPFLPFLYIAAGWAFVAACRMRNFVYGAFFFLLILGVLLHRIIPPGVLSQHMAAYRAAIVAGASILVAPLLFPKRLPLLFPICMAVGFIAIIAVQSYTVYHITPEHWYNLEWLKIG